MLDVLEQAVQFAVDAHQGMIRKSAGMPYILHPLEVACIAGTMTTDREVLAAAVMHDVVEDTGHTLEEIRERFGECVADLVASESENKRPELPSSETWRIRKEESLAELEVSGREVQIIWLADKLSNMRSFYRSYLKHGKALWEKFNMKDTAQQAWYYDTIARLTRDELGETLAWKEYDWLTHIVFEEELA